LLVSLQDLGAAGLTSAASEMASKGMVGLNLDVSLVPLREPGLKPFEIMVSESQERMLCVVDPARVDEVLAVCARWEVLATPIGEVTAGDRFRVLDGERVVGDLPVRVLVDDCPLYDLSPAAPSTPVYPSPEPVLAGDQTPGETLLALLGSANLASRRPVFEQYDSIVQSRTVRRPEETDAAVLALPDVSGIAVSIDGNGRRVACDPRTGAAEAVYECAANLACVGAEPLGLTNCLNFGNPEKPHVAWQLAEAVAGLAEACRALGVPVVGGNVSLYNEGPAGPIFPTPVVGMVGKLPDAAHAGRLGFARDGDAVALVGSLAGFSAIGSELAKLRGEPPAGSLAAIPASARDAHEAVRQGIRSGRFHSAHDVAEGGLGVALAECCLAGGIGATVALDGDPLFQEAPGRCFVVSGSEAALAGHRVIGTVRGDALVVEGRLEIPVSELRAACSGGLDLALGSPLLG
jgi:phosphoribosylformylglycinamidine synthase